MLGLNSDDLCYDQEGLEKKDAKWTHGETLALFVIRKWAKNNEKQL